ncbi:MAG: ComEC/Rec2 family competence protein [Christensenellales bacterium]
MEERAGRGLTGYRLWNVRPLFLAVLGFGIGIALCFYVRPHFGICVAICLGFGVCMLWLARTGRRGFFVMLVLMMIGLGWGRTTFSLQSIVSWPEDGYIQGDIHEIQEQEGVYTLLLDHVALEGIQTNEQMRVRTKSQAMQYARPGDAFEGYAFSIWAPDMDSVWDRAQRYANHWDKLAWVGETEAKVTQTGFSLRYTPARMREMVADRIDALFGQAAPTVKGMVLGDKTDLSEEQKTVYERAGISHILAVSGLHVGFLGMLVSNLLRKSKLGRKTQTSILLLLIWGYCAVVGFPASAVRATVMVSVRQCNLACGRRTDLLENLSLAALFILLWDPLQLLMPGFQLSFAAVWGIATVSSALASWKRGMGWLGRSISTSLGAQLGIWPISLYFFGGISTVSLLANLFVIPLASLITASVFGILLCSLGLPSIALGLAKAAAGLVFLMNYGAAWTARIPGALVSMLAWPMSTMLLFLASLFFLSPYCLWKARDRWTVAGLCWLVALLLFLV